MSFQLCRYDAQITKILVQYLTYFVTFRMTFSLKTLPAVSSFCRPSNQFVFASATAVAFVTDKELVEVRIGTFRAPRICPAQFFICAGQELIAFDNPFSFGPVGLLHLSFSSFPQCNENVSPRFKYILAVGIITVRMTRTKMQIVKLLIKNQTVKMMMLMKSHMMKKNQMVLVMMRMVEVKSHIW